MSAHGARWALSPRDHKAHAVADAASGTDEMVARCGHTMPAAAGLDDTPRALPCGACLLMVAPELDDRSELIH